MSALSWLMALDFAGSPFILLIETQPLVIFIAPARHQAVTATIDIMVFTAPARPQAVISATRGFE